MTLGAPKPDADVAFFAHSGSLASDYLSVDWSQTAVGAVESWPMSLRTAVAICIGSRLPMLLWWGPTFTWFYNEAYLPIIGERHPRSLGARGDIWPEVWDVVGPIVRGVYDSGEATSATDQVFYIQRHSFQEAAYFTYSHSPIRDEAGAVGGVFMALTETTGRVLSERRLKALSAVGTISPDLDPRELCTATLGVLSTLLDLAAAGVWHGGPGRWEKVAEFGRAIELGPDLLDGQAGMDVTVIRSAKDTIVAAPLPAPSASGPMLLLVRPEHHLSLDDDFLEFVRVIGKHLGDRVESATVVAGHAARAELLVAATTLGASSLEPDELLRRLAGLVVPAVSDWCGVYTPADSEFRRVVLVGPTGRLDDLVGGRIVASADLGDGGIVRRVLTTGASELISDTASDARGDVAVRLARGIGSILAVPLIAGGQTLGVLTLARQLDREPLGFADVTLAEELAGRAAPSVHNAVRYQRERRTAEILQRSLLPVLPELADLELAARYLPGDADIAVGGDWYDVIAVRPGRVAVLVGDVMGHGVQAAAMMGQLRAAVRAYTQLDLGPARVLSLLDRLVQQLDEENLATCLYGIVDSTSSSITLASAGHFAPFTKPADHDSVALDLPSGPPLGTGWTHYRQTAHSVPAGTVLALFTDGLVESRDKTIDDGLERVRAALDDGPQSLQALADHVIERMADHHARDDDTALLLMRAR
jgi:GAF domain-containing protein